MEYNIERAKNFVDNYLGGIDVSSELTQIRATEGEFIRARYESDSQLDVTRESFNNIERSRYLIGCPEFAAQLQSRTPIIDFVRAGKSPLASDTDVRQLREIGDIEVVTGVSKNELEEGVAAYLEGDLELAQPVRTAVQLLIRELLFGNFELFARHKEVISNYLRLSGFQHLIWKHSIVELLPGSVIEFGKGLHTFVVHHLIIHDGAQIRTSDHTKIVAGIITKV